MKRMLAVLLMLAMLLPCAALGEEEVVRDQPFYTLTEKHGFRFGGALSYYQLWDTMYLNFLTAHCNSITTTNEMKAYSLLDQGLSRSSEDGMPRMNYTYADQMVAWAQENGIGVRGHVLVWDAYMTDWFFHEDYNVNKPIASREVMLQRMESYITQVVTHFEEKFPGVVYCWDVVNEAVGEAEGTEYEPDDARRVRTSRSGAINPFYEYVGSDYVEYAFLYARNVVDSLGADIKLFYNDYNTFRTGKCNAIIELTRSINSFAKDENGNARKLCDGVGMQGYIGGYGQQGGCMDANDLGLISKAIKAYAAEGLEVQLTEMAVRNFDATKVEAHAEFYVRLFKVFRSVNSGDEKPLTGVSVWGMCDNPTDTPSSYTYKMNGTHSGLLDEKNQPKDVFWQIYDLLSEE